MKQPRPPRVSACRDDCDALPTNATATFSNKYRRPARFCFKATAENKAALHGGAAAAAWTPRAQAALPRAGTGMRRGWFLLCEGLSRAPSPAGPFPVSSLLLGKRKEKGSQHPPSNTPFPRSWRHHGMTPASAGPAAPAAGPAPAQNQGPPKPPCGRSPSTTPPPHTHPPPHAACGHRCPQGETGQPPAGRALPLRCRRRPAGVALAQPLPARPARCPPAPRAAPAPSPRWANLPAHPGSGGRARAISSYLILIIKYDSFIIIHFGGGFLVCLWGFVCLFFRPFPAAFPVILHSFQGKLILRFQRSVAVFPQATPSSEQGSGTCQLLVGAGRAGAPPGPGEWGATHRSRPGPPWAWQPHRAGHRVSTTWLLAPVSTPTACLRTAAHLRQPPSAHPTSLRPASPLLQTATASHLPPHSPPA